MFLSCTTPLVNKCCSFFKLFCVSIFQTLKAIAFSNFIASGICYNCHAIILKIAITIKISVIKSTLQDMFKFKTPYCFFGAYNCNL